MAAISIGSATWPLRAVRVAALAAVLGSLASPAAALSLDDIPVGAGYAAWELCTRVIASGDDYERVRDDYTAPKVKPLPWIWRLTHVPGDKVDVKTWLPGVPDHRIGLYRPGLGCTLVTPDASEAAVRAQPLRAAVPPPPSGEPWPLGEAPAEAGVLDAAQAALIARHASAIFAEANADASPRKPQQKLHAFALLVAKDGRLVHEQYRPGYQRQQAQLGWSMTKTVTSLIAGLMHRDGRIQLDEPVPLREWAGTDKAAITWRHLLNFAPGLAWDETYGGASDATRMLFNHADQGLWTAQLPLNAKPGTSFVYATGYSNVAMLAMRRMSGSGADTGSHQAIYDYYQQRLFAPLGIRGGVIEPDASGTPVGGARGLLRPVDWLRLGQLVARRGQWQGQALIAPDYMDFMLAPSPASAEYGAGIWRVAAKDVPKALRGKLPADLVWFAGHMGQFMVVVPSRQLVVLRMGVAFDKDTARQQVFALVADLLADGRSAAHTR